MHRDLRAKIKQAKESSAIERPDFVELLSLIDQHYDQMEATITQSLTNTTPIEAIFDSVSEALLSVSESGIVCNCNKICARYFGLPKDQLIGSKIEHILPETRGQTLDRFLTPFMPDLADTLPRVDGGLVSAVRANGDKFVAEIAASQIVAGEGRMFVISLRDVTDRQRAESALKENEERYRALVENAPESIVVFDVDKGRRLMPTTMRAGCSTCPDNGCCPSAPRKSARPCSPTACHLLASSAATSTGRWLANIRLSNGCTRIRMARSCPARCASAACHPMATADPCLDHRYRRSQAQRKHRVRAEQDSRDDCVEHAVCTYAARHLPVRRKDQRRFSRGGHAVRCAQQDAERRAGTEPAGAFQAGAGFCHRGARQPDLRCRGALR